jgi:hypothetical protein
MQAGASLEPSIQAIGWALYRRTQAHPPALYAGHRQVLERAVGDDRLRDAAAIAAHFSAYLGHFELGGLFGRALRLGTHAWTAPLLRATVARTARLFMVEETEAAQASASASDSTVSPSASRLTPAGRRASLPCQHPAATPPGARGDFRADPGRVAYAGFRHRAGGANDSDYALTGGVFSHLPEHLDAAQRRFPASAIST